MNKCHTIQSPFYFLEETFKSVDITEADITIDSAIKYIHIFDQIPDKRIQKKCKYKLGNLLLIIFMAKLTKAGDSEMMIARYAQFNKQRLEEYGIIENGEIPSHDTFRRVLELIDPEELRELFIEKLENFFTTIYTTYGTPHKPTHIGIDGKEFRGSGRSDTTKHPKSNLATLNVFDIGTQICLYSEPITKKESEITASRDILKGMKLQNTIITADALHCQKETAKLIKKKKGDYVFIAKDNQSGLKAEIIAKLEKDNKKCTRYESDTHSFRCLKFTKSYIGCEWEGQRMYIEMINKKTKEPIYFISSLSQMEMAIEAIQNRWSIENDLHRNKDKLLLEDNVRYTNKNAIANMAIINNTILGFYRVAQTLLHISSMKYTTMYFAINPLEAICKVLEVISSDQIITLLKDKMK